MVSNRQLGSKTQEAKAAFRSEPAPCSWSGQCPSPILICLLFFCCADLGHSHATACDSLSFSLMIHHGELTAALDTSSPLNLLSAQWPWGIWFGLAADKRDVSICGTEQTHLSSRPSLLASLQFPFLCVNLTFHVPSSLLYPSTNLFQASFLLSSFSDAYLYFTYLSWSSFLPPFLLFPLCFLLLTPFF